MRRSVVEDGGTAHALAAVPGEVAAIAGSASYGPDGGVRHVWTTGYRGDTAFAVLVEASGADTAPATDVAAELLRALPPG
jgi:hypothetical protein